MPSNNALPSLQGLRIALTTASDDPFSPAKVLLDREASILCYPVAQTLPPDSYEQLDAGLLRAQRGEVDWLLLTTPCAVEAIAERLEQLELTAESLAETKIALYGAKTRLVAASLFPAWQNALPAVTTHAEAISAVRLGAEDSVLLPLAQRSRADWPNLIAASGAEVISAPAYRLLLGRGGDDLPGLLWGGLVDAIVFLTENSVRHFSIRLKAEGGTLDMLGDVVAAALDPQSAAAAQAYGIQVAVLPASGTYPALVESLARYFSRETVQA